MYEIYLERRAERDLKRLSTEDFYKMISRIRSLSEEPRPPNCRKISVSKNDWRIRVGDYRIMYEVDDPGKAFRIMRTRHRREVYR